MCIFKNKILFKLIASVCVFLTLLNFGMTNNVYASDDEEVWGGPLVNPIMNLFTGIADGIMDILHSAVLEQNETLIKLDGTADTWFAQHGASVAGIIAGIFIMTVAAALTFATGGGAALAGVGILKLLAGGSFIIKTLAVSAFYGTVSGLFVTSLVNAALMSDDIYLPVFKLTPEEIFADKVWLFDVNFFDTQKKYYIEEKSQVTSEEVEYELNHSYVEDGFTYKSHNSDEPIIPFLETQLDKEYEGYSPKGLHDQVESDSKNGGYVLDAIYASFNATDNVNSEDKINKNDETTQQYSLNLSLNSDTDKITASLKLVNSKDNEVKYEILFIIQPSPALPKPYNAIVRVFEGERNNYKEPISQKIVAPGVTTTTELVETDSIAVKLNRVIASWYFILRNLALLVLMVVLIYTGIRIVTGSTAGEKAKYKERIIDWIVALCLVFILHYIMIFAVEITEKVTELVDSLDGTNGILRIIHITNDVHKDRINNNENNLQDYLLKPEEIDDPEVSQKVANGEEIFIKWGTDLTGAMRLDLQAVNEGTANWLGYGICYIILVLYTVFFAWTYLKRVVYMAFLTMMAPLVAMTYPIDKITDGKAQAFNQWLKEYIFNLLIQPFHLLLYTVLVGAAYQLAAENPLYAIVAIGFMLPAEKLLRKFFGFDKAQTPGLLGGVAGAALAMTGLQKLFRHGPRGSGGTGGYEDGNESKDSNKINFSSSEGVNAKAAVANETIGAQKDGTRNLQNAESGQTVRQQPQTDGQYDVTSDAKLQTPGFESPLGTDQNQTGDAPVPIGIPARSISYAPTTSSDVRPPRKSQKRHNPVRTIAGAVGAYGRGLGKKMTRRVNNTRPIRSLAKGIAGLYGATALGMAGLALGVASGDPSKAFQYGAAGLAGGYSVGKGLGGRAVDTFTVDNRQIKDAMEMAWAGDEYKKRKLKEAKEKMLKDEEYINYLRKTMGVSRKGAKEILERTGEACFDAGVTNIQDIATIEQMSGEAAFTEIKAMEDKMEKEIKERAESGNAMSEWEIQLKKEEFERKSREIEQEKLKNAISMKKFSDRTPDFTKLGAKKREEYRRQFEKEMNEEIKKQLKTQGISDEEADKIAKERAPSASKIIMEGITKFDDTKSNLTKA